jgi:hypothetical protein
MGVLLNVGTRAEMEPSLIKDAQSLGLEDTLAGAPPSLSAQRTLSRRLSLFSEPSSSLPEQVSCL